MPTSLIAALDANQTYIVFQNTIQYAFAEVVAPFMIETVVFGTISIMSLLSVYGIILNSKQKNAWLYAMAIVIFYGLVATHWSLQLRSAKHLLSGSALGSPITQLVEESTATLDEVKQVTLIVETLSNSFFIPVTAESVLFGVSLFLFAAAVFFIIKSSRTWRSFTGLFVRGSLFIMFAASLAHWVTVLYLWTTLSRGRLTSLSPESDRRLIALFECWAQLLAINIALSDSIVLWRMCILWAQRRSLIMLSCILIIVCLAMSIGNVVVSYKAFTILGKATPFWVAELALSWATNVFATSMIAIQAWKHRKRIRVYLTAQGSAPRLVERLMALLVESGAVYTSIWTAFIITGLVDQNVSSALTVLDTWDLCMAQLTLIYPTIIIILVTLERTHCEDGFTFQSNTDIAATTPAARVELNGISDNTDSHGRSSIELSFKPEGPQAADEGSVKSNWKSSETGWRPPAIAV